MKILNTAHPAYMVSDFDKAMDFYENCLGLKRKFVLKFSELLDSYTESQLSDPKMQQDVEFLKAHRDEVWLAYLEIAPHQYIELFPGRKDMPHIKTQSNQNGYLHLALEVDDIFKARKELLEKNVNVTSEISFGIEKTYQVWLTDPDGNAIELMQYTEDSYQIKGRL